MRTERTVATVLARHASPDRRLAWRGVALALLATSTVLAGACRRRAGPGPAVVVRTDTVRVASVDTVYRDYARIDTVRVAPSMSGGAATPGEARRLREALRRADADARAMRQRLDRLAAAPGASAGDDTSSGTPSPFALAMSRMRPGEFRVSGLDGMQTKRARSVYVHMRRGLTPGGQSAPPGTIAHGQLRDTIPVGDSATVCLSARKGDFAIEAEDGLCATQPIVAGHDTRWRWSVTPIDSGHRELHLRITSILAGSRYRFIDTAYVLRVDVAPESFVDAFQRWLQTTTGMVTSAAALLAAIAGLIAALLLVLKRIGVRVPNAPAEAGAD